MNDITLFYLPDCPYCMQAIRWMEELIAGNDAYRGLRIERIDERANPALADRYDYHYVPTFYVGGEKAHEGAATREIVEGVLRRAARAGE